MNRRTFLRLTGLVMAAQALQAVPASAAAEWGSAPSETPLGPLATAPSVEPALTVDEPGLYRVSGLVRLEAPVVEISGITTAQSISWSGLDQSETPLASFTTFEHFDRPGEAPEIRVIGGQLESLVAVLLDEV